MHGQLLAAGRAEGANDLDTYDVACLMWADLEALATANPFNAIDFDKRETLAGQLVGSQDRIGGDRGGVDAMRAELDRRAGREPSEAAQRQEQVRRDAMDELDELRAHLAAGGP